MENENLGEVNDVVSSDISSESIVSDFSAFDISNADTPTIAHDILVELVSLSSDNVETDNETSQADYSEQLDIIIDTISNLRTDVDEVSLSVDDIKDTLSAQPIMPDDYYSYSANMLGFHSFALGLLLGLLIVLLFVKGLRK